MEPSCVGHLRSGQRCWLLRQQHLVQFAELHTARRLVSQHSTSVESPSHDASAVDSSGRQSPSVLQRLGDGLGAAALAAMLSSESTHAAERGVLVGARTAHPLANQGGLHHRATATNVIQIFCPGGMSHVDTWDYRPELDRVHGQAFDAELGKQTFAGVAGSYGKSFWRFRQHGQSGRWLSDLFPLMARHVRRYGFHLLDAE